MWACIRHSVGILWLQSRVSGAQSGGRRTAARRPDTCGGSCSSSCPPKMMCNALIHSVAHPAFLYKFKILVRQSHHSHSVTQGSCSQLNCLHLWHVLWGQRGWNQCLLGQTSSFTPLPASSPVCGLRPRLSWQAGNPIPWLLVSPATEEPLVGTESSHCEGSLGF